MLPDTSLIAAIADSESSSYGDAATNVVTGRELVPSFSTIAHMDATLSIGQYTPTALAIEPALTFFSSLRSLHENLQLPLFLSGGLQAGASSLGCRGLHWS